MTHTTNQGGLAWLTERLELTRGGKQQNLRPMEGLRGLAVALVFLAHYVSLSAPWVPTSSHIASVATLVHASGNAGVDLFFVLSGYLIYGAWLSREQAFRDFIWRRIVRIYPVFLVMFAIYLLLSVALPAESKIPPDPLDAATYLLANLLLLPGIFPITPMITVAWSLSYEFFYYLLLPAFIGATGLRRLSPGARVQTFVALTVIAFVLFTWLGGPMRLLMFVSGILLFEWMRYRPHSTRWTPAGWAALLLAMVLAALPLPPPLWSALGLVALAVSFAVLCYASFSDIQGSLSRCLSWTPLRWLGNMSYSYYLMHGLTLKAFFLMLKPLIPPGSVAPASFFFLALVPAFAATGMTSLVLFLLVERPFSLAPKSRGLPGTPPSPRTVLIQKD